MKIRYSYTEYRGCPEATEISRTRGILRAFYSIALGFGILISIYALIDDFIGTWYIAIPVIFLCVLGFWYLVTRYEKVTERKITKAMAEKKTTEQKRMAEKYVCLSILALDNYKSGHCQKCAVFSEHLRECIVKDREGERFTFICNSCIKRYEQNKR